MVICFYWKLVFTNQYSYVESPDLAWQVLPWQQFQAAEWHRGVFPLWDPYEWGGQSLIGQAQPGAAYPPNWLLYLFPLRNGWIRQGALHWYYVLIHVMGALFAYLFCRDLKRSRAASFIAALAFTLGGWLGSTDWPQMINGAVWAPLVFLFLFRTLRDEAPWRNAALSGAFLGFSFLSGHHQIPIFMSLACAGLWLYAIFSHGFKPRILIQGMIFGGMLACMAAFQVLPAIEYGKDAVRWVNAAEPVGWNDKVPYLVHAKFGLGPTSILGIVIPGLSGGTNPFLGICIVCLAILGIARSWAESHVRLLLSIAIGGLLFSLASYTIFHGVLYSLIPGVEKARSSAYAIFIFNFAFAILSAYGIDHLPNLKISRIALWTGVSLFAVILLLQSFPGPKGIDLDRTAMVALCALGLAGLAAGFLKPRATVILLAGVVLIELGQSTNYGLQHREVVPNSWLKEMAKNSDIVEFLRKQPGAIRIEADSKIEYSFGDWHGLDAYAGFYASLPVRTNITQGQSHARLMLATNYTVAPKSNHPNQVERFQSATGLKVFENLDAAPRTFVIHDIGDPGPRFGLTMPELHKRTWVTGPAPKVETCSTPDDARLLLRDTNRVLIDATLGCKGMLVLAETFAPGWKAKVDGKSVKLYDPYELLRGVVVEPGHHTVEMYYLPNSVILGGLLTAFGSLVMAFLLRRTWLERNTIA